jgi:glycosyltransferase involved in cell wall biosynthesis
MAMSKPKVSVIIPTYNRRKPLERAVESVLAQDERAWELIVVDDASSDDTQTYLSSLTDPRIRAVALPRNVGPSRARNAGLDVAHAEIVSFLDSDDRYRPARLSATLAALDAEPSAVCTLSSGIAMRGGQVRRIISLPNVMLAPPAFEWGIACGLLNAGGSNITVRRSAAQAIGGFRPELHVMEDQDFMARLAQLGGCRLLCAPLWEKHLSDDALSGRWREAGHWLIRYSQANPDYLVRYRKLGSYFATKVLCYDLRRPSLATFLRDLRAFKRAGLIDGNVVRMLSNHRDVSRYRRAAWKDLANLNGPPATWA